MCGWGARKTYEDDVELGNRYEEEMLPVVREHFDDETIFRTKDRYHISDYIGAGGVSYELKTRECLSTFYLIQQEGVMIDFRKAVINDWLLFNFCDGLWKYKTVIEDLKTFPTQMLQRKDRACGHKDVLKKMVFIPFDRLELIKMHAFPRPVGEIVNELPKGKCLIRLDSM